MNKTNSDPISLATTKNTFYAYRAAWSYSHKAMGEELITQINNAQKNKNKSEVIFLIKKLETVTENIKRFPPDYEGKNLENERNGKYNSEWQQIKSAAPRSKSKKYQKLPEKWNERYFRRVTDAGNKYVDSIALLEISGCRPAEIEKGVYLALNYDGEIQVTIDSKKTHSGQYGQAFRIFTIFSNSPQFDFLKNKLLKNNNKMFIQITSARRLSSQMGKFSESVFTRMKTPVTPYTYRNQFAKALKSTLGDDTDSIAVAMGHSNDKSQTFYSRASSSSSGRFAIKNIQGTRDVKNITKPFAENTIQTNTRGLRR